LSKSDCNGSVDECFSLCTAARWQDRVRPVYFRSLGFRCRISANPSESAFRIFLFIIYLIVLEFSTHSPTSALDNLISSCELLDKYPAV
jgi:hypothetical protein